MTDKVKAKRLVRGRNPFLEFAVLCAMGSAALAFAVGLYLSANVGLVASLIAGIALFLVMAASQSALSRAHRFSEIVDRIEELQGSILRFNDDVDRIDRFAVKCKQFDDAMKRLSELPVLTDGDFDYTEVLAGDLDPGDKVVVGKLEKKSSSFWGSENDDAD